MQPHSFVLADLFDVAAMTLEVPDHIYELEPDTDWVSCPCCKGEKWLEVDDSPYRDACLAWGRPDLAKSYKPCLRCDQYGEILDVVSTPPMRTLALAA